MFACVAGCKWTCRNRLTNLVMRLTAVEALLQIHLTEPKNGPFIASTQIVVDLQSRLANLLVRMTAVEALLGQQALLTGRYTAAPYHYISQVIGLL